MRRLTGLLQPGEGSAVAISSSGVRPPTDHLPQSTDDVLLTFAERGAVAALAACVWPILAAYLFDVSGLAFTPTRMLAVLLIAAALTFVSFRDAARSRADGILLAAVVGSVAAWLLWLAWPTLLPLRYWARPHASPAAHPLHRAALAPRA